MKEREGCIHLLGHDFTRDSSDVVQIRVPELDAGLSLEPA